MNRQSFFAIGLILIVSFNLCLTLTVRRNNIKIGTRRNGDRLLDTNSQNFPFGTPQNIVKDVTYSTKNGARISQVEFNIVTDGNQDVTGSLLSGGEGKKDVAVRLYANGVTYLQYTVNIYGNGAALMPSLALITSFIFYIIYVNKQSMA